VVKLPNPAYDHADYLAILTNTTLGNNIVVDKKPEEPNAIISVHNTNGYPSIKTLGTNEEDIRKPGLMVSIRGNPGDYANSRAKADIIFAALKKKGNYMVNGNYYKSCLVVGDLGKPEYDEKNRPNWYINFELIM
jgi:hypothetical protein